MPQLIYTAGARRGLDRCRTYLAARSEEAAIRAAATISRSIDRLEVTPAIGRPVSPDRTLRELVIPFGQAGYVALYRYVPEEGVVLILAFRHQREANY